MVLLNNSFYITVITELIWNDCQKATEHLCCYNWVTILSTRYNLVRVILTGFVNCTFVIITYIGQFVWAAHNGGLWIIALGSNFCNVMTSFKLDNVVGLVSFFNTDEDLGPICTDSDWPDWISRNLRYSLYLNVAFNSDYQKK